MLKKKFKLLLVSFLLLNSLTFSNLLLTNATGLICFPDAYTLRPNNFRLGASFQKLRNRGVLFGFLEWGFLPQLEVGLQAASDNVTKINNRLLLSNIKYQLLKTPDGLALAVGYTQGYIPYVYSVLTKSIMFKNLPSAILLNGGIKYNKFHQADAFSGLKLPLTKGFSLMLEGYTYHESSDEMVGLDYDGSDFNDKVEVDRKIRYSFNIGAKFRTTNDLVTELFWRQHDKSFGLALDYLGIYQ